MNNLLAPEKVRGIQAKANSVLAKYKDVSSTTERLFQIAKDNQIEILEADLFDISGALRKEKGNWRIYVNKQDSPQRKRFTVAHELGHFFMHASEGEEFVDGHVFTRTDADRYGERELEANEFAGNLVMPEDQLRSKLTGTITEDTINSLAKTFEVSPFAMEIRLKNLGLLNGKKDTSYESIAA